VKKAIKAALETALPLAECLTGFRTAHGDYLRNRLRMLAGTYEAEEIRLFRQFLRPGQVIIDVGAHAGYLTRFFARATGREGKVYAFEPNPLIFPLLKRNVTSLKNVSVFNHALSSREGVLPLFLADNNHSVASLAKSYPERHLAFHGNREAAPVEVQAVTGDEFLGRAGIEHVDLIKIDVEGWEIDVLSGLEKTITAAANITIFCEFNPVAQLCAGRERHELLEWLLNRQFSLAYPQAGVLRTLSRPFLSDQELGRQGYTTIFATRNQA
jgi:FkbM family methyltransferase